MTLLLENPWPAILGGLAIEAVLCVLMFKTGRGFWLYIMGAVLLVAGGLVVMERLVVTERERVEQTLYDAAIAVERNDVPAIMEYFSQTPVAQAARNRVRTELPMYLISNVSLGDLTIDVNEQSNPMSATANFIGRCWVDERRGAGARMSYVGRLFVRLQKENGRWLLTDYEHRPLIER